MGTCLIKALALVPILIIVWIFSSPALAASQYFDQNGGGYSAPPSNPYFTWDPTTGSSSCPFGSAITSPDLAPCSGSVGGFSNTCCESSGGCTARDGSRINLWDFNYVSGCTATPIQRGFCSFSYSYQTQTCGATDTCQSSPYLYAGACNPACTGQTSCTGANACIVRGLYKTCCNSDGTVDGACYGGQFTGTCPAGTTTVLCGVDSGTCAAVAPYPCTTAACGQAACNTLAPPPPACTPNGSCSAPTPPCGTTTSGVDNCRNPCSRQGPACEPTPIVCDPYSQGPICDTAYCPSDGSVCAQGHQYCLWDGSDYGPCSEEINNCASQCTT